METRQKTEYKVWILELADMHGGVDKAHPVAIFTELQKLKDYYYSQLAELPYTDEDGTGYKWHKVFKKHSPLEWYNACKTLEEVSFQNAAFGGVRTDWIDFYPTRESINRSLLFNPT